MKLGKLDFTTIFVYAFLAVCIDVALSFSRWDWLKVPYALSVAIRIVLAICSIWYLFKHKCFAKPSFLLAIAVLVMVTIGVIRGVFNVEGYWGYKGWLNCALSALNFVLIFPLSNPSILKKCLQAWNRYILPLFVLFCLWAVHANAFAFQLPIIYYFFLLFFCMAGLSWKERAIMLFGVVCIILGMENRSGVIKTAGAILLCSTLILPTYMAKVAHFFLHILFYLLPIILLYLGITGRYNVFQALEDDSPHEITVKASELESQSKEMNVALTADTRTFLYEEVIMSAVKNDYVVFGNSVGRGNTHNGEWSSGVEGMDDSERLMNEAGMLNIFTWMGLVGVVIYTLMYLQSSCLGLFFSKNRYIPIIACAVAFHWTMSWLEESTRFAVMDFSLFLLMAICFSPQFRKMSNIEFQLWFQSCFAHPRYFTNYDLLQTIKLRLVLKHETEKKNEQN